MNTSQNTRRTMTIRELSEVMQISLPTAYNLTEREDFPLIRLGRKKLVPIKAFDSWLAKQTESRGDDD